MTSVKCWCCGKVVEPLPPRTARKILNVVFWTASLAVSMAFAIPIGLDLVLVPIAIAMGCSVGTTAREAAAWSCSECHAELRVPEEEVEKTRRRLVWRHA